MLSFNYNLYQVFRQFDHPVLKHCRKKFRQRVKNICRKLVPSPDKKARVHCKNTPARAHTSCSVAVQTSSNSLLESLSHNGELDMSYHLNSNCNNNRAVSKSLRPGQGSSVGHSRQSLLLPNRTSGPFPLSKKPTSSTGTRAQPLLQAGRENLKRNNATGGHSSRTTQTTLPMIEDVRSPSPVSRRRSNSVSAGIVSADCAHSFIPSQSSAHHVQPHRPVSPARERRRVIRANTQRDPIQKSEASKSSSEKKPLSSPRTSLYRSSSLSSLMQCINNIEDSLHSENYWGLKQIPDFLKIKAPSATKAEETPRTSTLDPSEGRHSKCVKEASSRKIPVETIRIESPTAFFKRFLRSLKNNPKKKDNSKGVQVTMGIEAALISGGVVGLRNLGNTCFMNSALQCLSHTLEMTQAYLRSDSLVERKGIGRTYARLMQDIWSAPTHYSQSSFSQAICPQELKRSLGRLHSVFAGYGQQDSQELLRLLVSALHEEMLRSNKTEHKSIVPITTGEYGFDDGEERWWSYFRNEDTPISRVFMGQLKSTVTCGTCRYQSITYDPIWDIALPFPKSAGSSQTSFYPGHYSRGHHHDLTLEDCITQFTKEEILDKDNKAWCNRCDKPQCSSKQMTINRFPPVLVLYLQRFSGFSFRKKLDNIVQIPLTLDLTSYASEESRIGKYFGKRIKYELYAISNHMGGVSFGHYTALIKHYATEQWYLFDDASVQRVHDLNKYLKGCQPYMMFYRRSD